MDTSQWVLFLWAKIDQDDEQWLDPRGTRVTQQGGPMGMGKEDLTMALWKEYLEKEQVRAHSKQPEGIPQASESRRPLQEAPPKSDSIIAAGLTVEGKIQGVGHLRIAGRFQGDVQVDGDLTIEPGAQVTGDLRASTVNVGGEVQGNIQGTTRVQLLQSGAVIGDVKAGSLTVAAGSRMRGKVEFGWEEEPTTRGSTREEGEPR
jgi:cytoskeletal protein CcmA (bactofilin family)